MTQLLLMAPKPVLLLPALTATVPAGHRISTEAKRLLKGAYAFANGKAAGDRYFPIHSAYLAWTTELIRAGLLEPQGGRRTTWHRITDRGRAYIETQKKDPRTPRQVDLETARFERFQGVCRELAAEGYAPLPEPTRGWQIGQVAFFREEDGRKLLMTCRLGTVDWRFHMRGYYCPSLVYELQTVHEREWSAFDQKALAF